MEEIYEIIAEENGVTADEVEKAISEAIAMADSPEIRKFREDMGRDLTVEELILLCISRVL